MGLSCCSLLPATNGIEHARGLFFGQRLTGRAGYPSVADNVGGVAGGYQRVMALGYGVVDMLRLVATLRLYLLAFDVAFAGLG